MGVFRDFLTREARLPFKKASEQELESGSSLTLGVEVEFLLPNKTREMGFKGEEDLKEFLSPYWEVGDDPTVEPLTDWEEENLFGSFEVRTEDPVPVDDYKDLLVQAKKLEEIGAYLNDTCGIHIHVGTFNLEWNEIPLSFLLNLASLVDEPGIYTNLPKRRISEFAKSIRRAVAKILRDPYQVWTADAIKTALPRMREFGTNMKSSLAKQGTIEFRYFGGNGAFNRDRDLKPYIQYVSNLVKYAMDRPYKVGGLEVVGNEVRPSLSLLKKRKKAGITWTSGDVTYKDIERMHHEGELRKIIQLATKSPLYRNTYAHPIISSIFDRRERFPEKEYLDDLIRLILVADEEDPIYPLAMLLGRIDHPEDDFLKRLELHASKMPKAELYDLLRNLYSFHRKRGGASSYGMIRTPLDDKLLFAILKVGLRRMPKHPVFEQGKGLLPQEKQS